MSDAGPRQWTVVVDYVPGGDWEAHLEEEAGLPRGWCAETLQELLAAVARDLYAEVEERAE